MLTNISYDKDLDHEYIDIGEYEANVYGKKKLYNKVVGKRTFKISYNPKRNTVRRYMKNEKIPLVDSLGEIASDLPKDILDKILKLKR